MSGSLELVLEPAITPTGPMMWSARQQHGIHATMSTGKRGEMVDLFIGTRNQRLKEGFSVCCKVYGKDGSLEEHVQYEPDGSHKKLPISAKAAEGFGRRCATLGTSATSKPAKKAAAGKVLGALKAALDALEGEGSKAKRKAQSAVNRAKAADLGNGAASKRDELVAQVEAAIARLAKPAKAAKPKKEKAAKEAGPKKEKAAKPASGRAPSQYQTFVANRAPVLREKGLDNKAVMVQIGKEWNALKAAGQVPPSPTKTAKAAGGSKSPKKTTPKAEAAKTAKTSKAASTSGEETYQQFAARRLPALQQLHGKNAMAKLGEEWQLEKAARRVETRTGQRPKSMPPKAQIPAKAPPKGGNGNGSGKRTAAPAALPNDPNVAQLALFLQQRKSHAAT